MYYTGTACPTGFYKVGNLVCNTKIEAILASDSSGLPIEFIYNDEEYSKYNWAVEPKESLAQLSAIRAQELRNKYDYIILLYSGGHDSNAVLETFIRNNIPIDEILIRNYIYNNHNVSAPAMAVENNFTESKVMSYPIAQQVKKDYFSNLVINVLTEETQVNIDYFSSTDHLSFYSLDRGVFAPSNTARGEMDSYISAHRDMINHGKRICYLLGFEKPPVYLDKGVYKVRFLDKKAQNYNAPRSYSCDIPVNFEGFFWDSTTAKLQIKQAHTIRNYMIEKRIDGNYLNTPNSRKKHDFIANIIYEPRIFPLLYTTEKDFTPHEIKPWDYGFFKDENGIHVQNWKKMMAFYDDLIPSRFKHDGKIINGMIGIFSKSYTIGADHV